MLPAGTVQLQSTNSPLRTKGQLAGIGIVFKGTPDGGLEVRAYVYVCVRACRHVLNMYRVRMYRVCLCVYRMCACVLLKCVHSHHWF